MARERSRPYARSCRRVPLRFDRQLWSWIFLAFCLSCGAGHLPDGPDELDPPAVTARRAALSTPLSPPTDSILPTSVSSTTGLAAGALQGHVGVSRDGAATYTIPLWSPAGRAGMSPDLSLVYNSRGVGGGGVLGAGWALTGLSQITRCKSNPFINRKHRSVQFDSLDQFCLDGEPLTVISGSYGAAGAVYRTVSERFVKVVSGPVDAQGPGYFTVYFRDGRIGTFGATPGTYHSRIEGNALRATRADPTKDITTMSNRQVRLGWALERLADRSGNYLTVTYAFDVMTANNAVLGGPAYDLRPTQIAYTGSSTTAPTRFVTFKYEPRVYSDIRFVGGMRFEAAQRVRSIEISGPDPTLTALIKSYVFGYIADSGVSREILQSVKECDRAGVCKAPTTFHYEQTVYNQFSAVSTGIDPAALGFPTSSVLIRTAVGDINGDGRDDLVYKLQDNNNPSHVNWYFSLSTGAGFAAPVQITLNNPGQTTLRIVDLNKDGKSEIVQLIVGSSTGDQPGANNNIVDSVAPIVRKTGVFNGSNIDWVESDTFNYYNGYFQGPAGGRLFFPASNHLDWVYADLNGDALPDVIFGQRRTSTYRLNTSSGATLGFGPPVNLNNLDDLGSDLGVDMDANGTAEFLVASFTSGAYRSSYSGLSIDDSGALQITETGLVRGSLLSPKRSTWFVDVNGDGLEDAVTARTDGGGEGQLALNTGAGFLSPLILPSFGWPQSKDVDTGPRFFDLDLDGRVDVWSGGGNVLLSRGATLVETQFSVFGAPQQTGALLPQSQVLDYDGNGIADLLILNGKIPTVLSRNGARPWGLLLDVTDGMGRKDTVEYKPMLGDAYTPGSACTFPQVCLKRGPFVVSSTSVVDPLGTHTTQYTYEDARLDVKGPGWLGFRKITMTNADTATTDVLEFASFRPGMSNPSLRPFVGMVEHEQVITRLDDGTVLSVDQTETLTEQQSTFGTVPSYFAYSTKTVEVNREWRGTACLESDLACGVVATTTHEIGRDRNGNVLYDIFSTPAGDQDIRHIELFPDDEANWLIGRTKRETSLSASAGVSVTYNRVSPPACTEGPLCRVRLTETHYVTGTKLVSERIREPQKSNGADPEQAALYKFTVYQRDAFGQVKQADESDLLGAKRTWIFDYDPVDRTWPAVVTDPMNHVRRVAYHSGLGVPTVLEDENGVQTTAKYDGFGRRRQLSRPGIVGEKSDYVPDPMVNSVARATITRDDGPVETFRYDQFGREVERDFIELSGTSIVETHYDALGRVREVTAPRFVGDTKVRKTVLDYDRAGRLVRRTNSLNAVFSFTYTGLERTETDENLRTVKYLADQRGRVVKVTDGSGHPTTYDYGPFNVIRQVTAGTGTQAVVYGFDAWSRIRSIQDPDRGNSSYTFSAFDELATATDGRGAKTTYVRDGLGRPKTATAVKGTETRVQKFTWDTSVNGIGKLHWHESPDLARVTFGYDSSGKVVSETRHVGAEDFITTTERDTLGRPSVIRYPDIPSQPRFSVGFHYAPTGDLSELWDVTTSTPAKLWTLNEVEPGGQLQKETFGSQVIGTRRYDSEGFLRFSQATKGATVIQHEAYEYDPAGNLAWRHNLAVGSSEHFTYDAENRVSGYTFAALNGSTCVNASWTYTYDAFDNLKDKIVNVGGEPTQHFLSGQAGFGPHQVSSLNGAAFGYDLAGNQTSGPGRIVTFDALSRPVSVTSSGTTTAYAFYADGSRASESRPGENIVYGAPNYERRVISGTTSDVFTIQAGPRKVAQRTVQNGTVTLLYVHDNHIGSVAAVSSSSGGLNQRRLYEPFGRKRTPGNVSQSDTTPSTVRDGFAGQRDDPSGLVFMGARLYDPVSARFLSPDPSLGGLTATGVNPYAYGSNSPATRIDPDGREDVPAQPVPPGGFSPWEGGGFDIGPPSLLPPAPPVVEAPKKLKAAAPNPEESDPELAQEELDDVAGGSSGHIAARATGLFAGMLDSLIPLPRWVDMLLDPRNADDRDVQMGRAIGQAVIGVGQIALGIATGLGAGIGGGFAAVATGGVSLAFAAVGIGAAAAEITVGIYNVGRAINTANNIATLRESALAKNLKNAGQPRPSPGHRGHHIAPENDGRFPECDDIRDILKNFNLDIQQEYNGVWLRDTAKVPGPEAVHATLHTRAYYRKVLTALQKATNAEQAKDILRTIKADLLTNTF